MMLLLLMQTGAFHNYTLRESTKQLPEIHADTHSQTVDGAWGLLEYEEDYRPQRRQELHKKTNKVNYSEPLGLTESEPPTKGHTWAGPRPPHTYAADVQLHLHAGLQQLEQGLSLNLLPAYGIGSPNWAALSGLSGRGCA